MDSINFSLRGATLDPPVGASLHAGVPKRAEVFAVAITAAFWCAWNGWRHARPREDAAILFRYVDNLASTGGIAWNPGGEPVDGATDMGFMVLLAGLRVLGISADLGALVVNSLAFVLIAVGLFTFTRRRLSGVAAVVISLLFVLSPATWLIRSGFGTVFFTGIVALCVVSMFRLTDDATVENALVLGGTTAIAGLIRPEGFLIGGVLIATAAAIGGRPVLRAALVAGATMSLAAFAFGLARWTYFGYPLPNPFYKKGGGTLHTDGLVDSRRFASSAGAIPLLLLLLAGLAAGFSRRWIAYIACIAALLAMWVLLSSEMNFDYRFQFPLLVMGLLMCVDVAKRAEEARILKGSPARLIAASPLAGSMAFLIVFAHIVFTDRALNKEDLVSAQETIAKTLADSGRVHLTVATTEAGYICWKSGWNCFDLWGLNDKNIAHHGYLNEDALAHINPDVIVVHAPTSPIADSIHAAPGFLEGWESMTDPVIRYAEGHGYILAAILRPESTSGYAVYVRNGEPWSRTLVSEFGRLAPTVEQFYGTSAPSHLPTNE